MSELLEKGVSNNDFCRKQSNKLDKKYFNDHPAQRALVHYVYHAIIGVSKTLVGNETGATAEFKRSKEQLSKARKGTPPKKK
jgi:hypothetical protein